MAKMFVTFGQVHLHRFNNKTFDKDCVAVIECDSYDQGRLKAQELFGMKFCFTYYDTEWAEADNLHYYPRGYVFV